MSDLLANFRKDLTKADLEEVAGYNWDEATKETFSDFLKRVKVIAKQACHAITCLFGKLSINIQQDLMNKNKEDASPEETKEFLHQRQQHNYFALAKMRERLHLASVN